jgi:NAD(P)-dependent dehydrogenase (short-subunit alcohol dehydrogenase family)
MNEGIDLGGQVALVTGGGRGLGRAVVLALARRGAAVAVVARSEDQLAETAALVKEEGGRAAAFAADVTDQQAVDHMARQVERQIGPVDLLVNNAGAFSSIGPMWEVPPDEWWQCIAVNLLGPFLCSRAVLPGMVARGRGRIMVTVSGAGTRPWPYSSAYAIGKCAAIRFCENLAVETKEQGISVFAIHPTFVRTAMTEAIAASPDHVKWHGGGMRKGFAAGRDASPERLAQLAVTLASGAADALSGCFITVDDDVAEMVQRAEEIQRDKLYTLGLRT